MSAPHLPYDAPFPPVPGGVIPIGLELGTVLGHRLTLLSLERWQGWADLRFARVDVAGQQRLARRVPPKEAWRVRLDGTEVEVFDAVGRGDRWFSNGEVRIVATPQPGATLEVAVELAADAAPLTGSVLLGELT